MFGRPPPEGAARPAKGVASANPADCAAIFKKSRREGALSISSSLRGYLPAGIFIEVLSDSLWFFSVVKRVTQPSDLEDAIRDEVHDTVAQPSGPDTLVPEHHCSPEHAGQEYDEEQRQREMKMSLTEDQRGDGDCD